MVPRIVEIEHIRHVKNELYRKVIFKNDVKLTTEYTELFNFSSFILIVFLQVLLNLPKLEAK